MTVLWSIHDVWPATLDAVDTVVRAMVAERLPPAPLLVSPGHAWRPEEVARLRGWADAGHELVAHGWTHRAETVRGVRHRLHACLLSRRAAEHLALPPSEIVDLLERSAAWFRSQALPVPRTYVPPAWALGPLTRGRMGAAPFRWFESLTGIYDSEEDCWHRLPLLGFEADTLLRQGLLSVLNAVNRAVARCSGRPIRIAIHPHDLDLRLGNRLAHLLAIPQKTMTVDRLGDRGNAARRHNLP